MNKNRKIIIGIYIAAFFSNCYAMTNALIPDISAAYSHLPYSSIVQIMTLPSLIGMFSSFLIGPLAQKFNKKILLVISVASLLGYFLLFLIFGNSGMIGILYLASGLAGITIGCNLTLLSLIINAHFDSASCTSMIGMTYALLSGGAALFTFLGGNIAATSGSSHWNYSYFLGLAIIPALIVIYRFIPDDNKKKADEETFVDSPSAIQTNGKFSFRLLAIIMMKLFMGLCAAGFSYYYSTLLVTEYELGTIAQAGIIGSVGSISGMIAGITCGFWRNIFKKTFIPVCYAITCLSVIFLLISPESFIGFIIAAILNGMGTIMGASAITAKMLEEAPAGISAICTAVMVGMGNVAMYISTYVHSFFGEFLGGGIINSLVIAAIAGALGTLLGIYIAYGRKYGE